MSGKNNLLEENVKFYVPIFSFILSSIFLSLTLLPSDPILSDTNKLLANGVIHGILLLFFSPIIVFFIRFYRNRTEGIVKSLKRSLLSAFYYMGMFGTLGSVFGILYLYTGQIINENSTSALDQGVTLRNITFSIVPIVIFLFCIIYYFMHISKRSGKLKTTNN